MSPNRSTQRRNGGFTLLEILVVVVVLTITVTAALRALRVGTDTYQAGMTSGACHEECRRVVETVAVELLPAQVIYVETDPTLPPELEYLVPVDMGGDGDFVDTTGNIEWGTQEVAGPVLGSSTVYRFASNATLRESDIQFDIDGDGALDGTFLQGNLVMETTGGRTATYGQGLVVVHETDSEADMNGDGTPDPIFSVTLDKDGNFETVAINIWMVTRDKRGRYIKLNETTSVRLRNNQT